jgi:hypothetical protein
MNNIYGILNSTQFVQFAYLQALDLLSTIAFLVHGVGEANPLVRWSMQLTPHPLGGLFVVKCVALMMAFYAIKTQREKLMSRINLFYAGIISWNLVCLVLAA